MPKTKKQLKSELKEDIELMKSLLRSLEDIKQGRVYPMDLSDSKT